MPLLPLAGVRGGPQYDRHRTSAGRLSHRGAARDDHGESLLSAGARATEVQRYLRQLEQQVLPATLHPNEARHAIATALWRAARGCDSA